MSVTGYYIDLSDEGYIFQGPHAIVIVGHSIVSGLPIKSIRCYIVIVIGWHTIFIWRHALVIGWNTIVIWWHALVIGWHTTFIGWHTTFIGWHALVICH